MHVSVGGLVKDRTGYTGGKKNNRNLDFHDGQYMPIFAGCNILSYS